MELADVPDSKSGPGNRVRVRPPPPAPKNSNSAFWPGCCFFDSSESLKHLVIEIIRLL